MFNNVKVYYMSEAERLKYIEKHPITPTRKAIKRAERGLSTRTDYRWRPEKAAAARSKNI